MYVTYVWLECDILNLLKMIEIMSLTFIVLFCF